MTAHPRHVAIVGGGITGLAVAFGLQEQAAEAGVPITCELIEGEHYWGGKILTRRVDDLLIEAGPDSFLSQKPAGLVLCAKLGLSDQVVNTNESDKGAYVYSRGRLRALPEGLVLIAPSKIGRFVRSGLVSPLGMARMALDFVLPARRSTDDESLASFFSRRFGREVFDRLIEPLMAGIYAGDAEQMSLRATFPRFFDMEQQQGSLLRAMLKSKTAGRASSASGSAARTMFVTLRNGLGTLADALVARIKAGGGSLRLGRRVVDLRVRTEGRTRRTYQLGLASEEVTSADVVVLATPAYVTADLVRPLSAAAANLLTLIPYASTITVSLAFDRASLGNSIKGFGFVVPRVEGRSLLAATWSSRKWPHRAPPSQVLVRCYLGGVGREEALTSDDKMLVRMARHELWSLAGISAEPRYVEINRWGRAMPQYTLGHLGRLDMIQSLLGHHPGLYLAGAGYRGVGIPDCIKDGTETAKKVIHYLEEHPT